MRYLQLETGCIIAAFVAAALAGGDAVADNKLCSNGFSVTSVGVYDGISLIYESCSNPLYRAFIAKVSLANVSYEIVTTPKNLIYSELTEFARATGAVFAVNGGFFGPKHGGWFMTGGRTVGKYGDNEYASVLAFGKNAGGRIKVEIFPPEHIMPKKGNIPSWVFSGVTAMPVLIKDGVINTSYPPDNLVKFRRKGCSEVELTDLWRYRHPRTAAGISKEGNWMIFVVVDGRQKGWSRGMNMKQLSLLMKRYGVWNGVNLDGGCSSAMWVQSEGGIVNSQCIQHGKVRKTANHIGVVPVNTGRAMLNRKLLTIIYNPLFII